MSQQDTSIDPRLANEMITMMAGQMFARAIWVATKLGVADVIAEHGPLTAEALTQHIEADAPMLHRLLRSLTMRGIFAIDENGAFRLTPMAQFLRHNVDGSLAKLALMFNEVCYEAVAEMKYTVTTGETAFNHVWDMWFFEHLAQNPDKANLFGESMSNYVVLVHQGLINTYDFSSSKTVADIGGSYGALLNGLLTTHPHLQATLFDLPHVVAEAEPHLERAGIADKVTLVGGDFFEAVPADHDLYILSSIIHDWPDDRALKILQTVRAAIPDHGKLILMEAVVPSGNEPAFSKILDLIMMTVTGGVERTAQGYEALLVKAGFKMTQIIPTPSAGSIIEATPV